MSACAPLALQAMSQLLEAMGEPQRLSPTETELEREQRLLKQTCNLKFMSWFDGSPILNRSWVTHYVMLHYDSLRMRLSSDAQVACRRACSNPPVHATCPPVCISSHPALPLSRHPRIYMLVPWGEQFDLTLATCRERSEDFRTLNHGVEVRGMVMHFANSVLMGDTPVQQIMLANKVGGNNKCTHGRGCLLKVRPHCNPILQPYCKHRATYSPTHLFTYSLTYYAELCQT